ncbi:putative serine/threonine-protein kinase PBL28 isoform X2 [Bidens hawaiensis]|uniref:putative serine/threonine-protein kinase PBL28 isoform X2 n=1 Tax=Bidens hawaiensis TaxID=980011 RepID=UPI00404B8C13
MAEADLKNLDHLRIPLEDIISATDNFARYNILGHGGFGSVYKGQLPGEPGTTVAVKKLGVQSMQGDREFLTEIATLASCKHKNLVSLVGFSDQGNEKIVVYKKEDNGSLDKYLDSIDLTWEQRLRICLGAARGLEYLHSGVGAVHRVLHRDVKSSNILLDADWEAKISDFGLSKIGPRNMFQTFLVTAPCGTLGYIDPKYVSIGVLTKESDVYSFGVVLFEVLCGRAASIEKFKDEFEFLSVSVKNYCGEGKLDEIIFPSLLEQMKPNSLEIFSKIAFRCLNEERSMRPTMRSIVEELESALEHQLGTRTRLWGSQTGGNPFLFQLKSNRKLKKITIFHDVWIHALIFTTQDFSGSLESIEYGFEPYYTWVRESTNAKKFEINLDDDEEIIGLSGSVGKYKGNHELITSLCVTTNKRKYGPFTHEAEDRFSGSWDTGLFDGFYGRAGEYIDAIGCCLKATALAD